MSDLLRPTRSRIRFKTTIRIHDDKMSQSRQSIGTQKRNPQPLTPYKSILKEACDRIGPQECPTHGRLHPLPGAVYYDHSHLLAPVRHGPVPWDARHLEKPASPHLM